MATITDDQAINDIIKGLDSAQIKQLGTWNIVKAPPDPGINIVNSHFVLHREHDTQGNLSRKYCPADDTATDISMKSLGCIKFEKIHGPFNLNVV